MIELPCPVCGSRSVDEFRRLADRTGPEGEVEARWWHVLGCRRVCDVPRPDGDDDVAPVGRPAPGVPEDAWPAPELVSPPPAALPRRKGAEPARLVAPLPAAPPSADLAPGPNPTPAAAAVPVPDGRRVPIGIGGPPAGGLVELPAPGPAVPGAPGEPSPPGGGDEVLVALPDAPPVPFERPEWPSGAEAATDEPPAPPPLPAPRAEDAEPEATAPNDRFRERRAAAQPVERVVRRPVGLVGPSQPRAVEVTRRPPVEHRPAQRQPGVEPRPAAAASSLFARTRTWGTDPPSEAGPAEGEHPAGDAGREAADAAGGGAPEAEAPDTSPGPAPVPTAEPAPPGPGAGGAGEDQRGAGEDQQDEAGELAEPAAEEVPTR